jgi:hypothetical protein
MHFCTNRNFAAQYSSGLCLPERLPGATGRRCRDSHVIDSPTVSREAPIIIGVQIDPRRLGRAMPQVLLNEADIGAGVSLMGGCGMTLPVR